MDKTTKIWMGERLTDPSQIVLKEFIGFINDEDIFYERDDHPWENTLCVNEFPTLQLDFAYQCFKEEMSYNYMEFMMNGLLFGFPEMEPVTPPECRFYIPFQDPIQMPSECGVEIQCR